MERAEALDLLRERNQEYRVRVGSSRKMFFMTFGCQMNLNDAELIGGMLSEVGYEKTEELEQADIIIINTCGVRDNAEQRVYGRLGNLKPLKEKRPDLIIAIGGCMVQQTQVAEHIRKVYRHVGIIFGTHNIHTFPELLAKAMISDETIQEIWPQESEVVENLPRLRDDGRSAWVTITYGCNNFCTYCIVPYVRGRERSRQPEAIVKEVAELARKGYIEVTLLGQNVNSYGKGLEPHVDFGDLLMAVNDVPGIKRIRYTTSHPRDFSDHIIEAIAKSAKVCPHIHLPVQAGSNRILKAMNRGYTREYYLELVAKIRRSLPDCSITTDLIVGFPGETDEDFAQTVDLVQRVRYDNAFTFIYSPRTGTPAATMADQVSEEIKQERIQCLMKIQAEASRSINEQLVGRTIELLVEGESKTNPDILTGRTTTNKVVNFRGDKALIGQLVDVKITTAQSWYLIGELSRQPTAHSPQ